MGVKSNPLLAMFEAKLEAKHEARLKINEEISLITHLISCHEDLKVGPGRAEKVLNGFLETKVDIYKVIAGDTDDYEYSMYVLVRRLKQIMGPENWEKYKVFFPSLKEFWDAN